MSNSIIIVAWPLNGPRVEQPSSVSNILQGDSSCLPSSPLFPLSSSHHYPSRVAPRSPPLSRVHSCLLVARTSLPAVNGDPSSSIPRLSNPLSFPSLAPPFSLFILFPSLFQKLPSHGSPLVRFSALSSLTRSSRHRGHERTRFLDLDGERINISSLIFEISSLYPESLTLYFQWNYFRNFRTIPRIRSLSQVSHDRLCPSSLEGEEEEEEVDGNFGGAYFSFRARKVNRATRLYPGSAHLEARA